MIARLSTILIAGSILLAESPQGTVSGSPAPTLQELRLSAEGQGASVYLGIPGYKGTPTLNVIQSPERVVIDLPGVRKGTLAKSSAFNHPLIKRRRIAQFQEDPSPITRMVLEVAVGTTVEASVDGGGLLLKLQPGRGAVTARLVSAFVPVSPTILANPVPEVVTAALSQRTDVVLSSPVPKLPILEGGMSLLPVLAVAELGPTTVSQAQERQTPAEPPAVRRSLGETTQRYTGALMSIDQENMDLSQYLRAISTVSNMNLILDPDIKKTVNISFKNTPWDQILDHVLKQNNLGKTIEGNTIRIATVEKLRKEEQELKELEDAKALSGAVQTRKMPLSFAKVGDARTVVERVLSGRGKVFADERTNTLFVTDLPKQFPLIEEMVNTLDVAVQQVAIEARIVEANIGFGEKYGVKFPAKGDGRADLKVGGESATWAGSKGPYWNGASGNTNGKDRATFGGWTSDLSIGAPAGEFWVAALSQNFNVNFILQAAQSEGKAKVVSTPKVLCFNNQKGTVSSGEKIPYPTIQAGQNAGAVTVAFMDAKLELEVTPQITNDGSIIMELKVDNSSADFAKQVNGTPAILTKMIQTKCLVKNGGTAVLGGIYITRTSKDSTGIPFLNKLPVIGGLFRNKSNEEESRELLVFITPKIVGKD